MILPYAHEDLRARRWPVVTFGIIALNVLAYAGTYFAEQSAEPRVEATLNAVLMLYGAHPTLSISPRVTAILDRDPQVSSAMSALAAGSTEVLGADERDRLQTQLDDACTRAEDAYGALPSVRFGYTPAHPRVWQLVTSLFVHAGILHLVGNMWFLWLACVSLEDRWGRLAFAAFYVLGGMVASFAHGLVTPDKAVPLVGASGAIAAAMGAFLAIFAKTRIQFFYVFYRVGRFTAPAYVMLPLWVAEQVFDSMTSQNDGVAYVAHVAGFAFGLAVALALRFGGIDAKLDRAVEGTVSIDVDPLVEKAEELERAGKRAEAVAAAREALRTLDARMAKRPADVLAALRLLTYLGREPDDFERFVALAASDDFSLDEAARVTAARVRELGPDAVAKLPPPLRIRIAKRLDRLGDLVAAEKVRPL